MKTGSFLLGQLEKCGLSAQLAEQHAEASDDSSGFRLAKIEIARAFNSNDQPTIPEADAALNWLMGEIGNTGKIVSVGESLDLIDQTTGEVLVTGRPNAVLADPCMVVSWRNADAFYESEPEDDLGLVAMGLAASDGQPFRVATLAIRGMETFARRSPEFLPDKHPALLARIKAAVGRPRIACPGDWCGACRQAIYCPSWLARVKTALQVFDQETVVIGPDGTPSLDITNETAPALSVRLKMLEKAIDLAKDQLKAHVRNGGRCVVDSKEYYLGLRDGRETADVAALKADGLLKYIKKGQSFESAGWRKVRSER